MQPPKKILEEQAAHQRSGHVPLVDRAHVQHTVAVEVSPADVERIFRARLSALRSPFWCYMGDVNQPPGWYVTYDSYGRGSDIDQFIAPFNHPDFALERAVLELERILDARARLRNMK